jgi:serine/threonine-protein kinase
VRDVGEAHGKTFLVLELVDGWSLARLLERAAAASMPLPPRVAAHIVLEACRGLTYAHDRGVVHCDVCPHNILVAETGEVKLTDFGIARTTTRPGRRGVIAGKPAYMSPEQAAGAELDLRSDLFSLGTVLYFALCGTLPFSGSSDEEVMARVVRGDFASPFNRRPSLPSELGELVLGAMRPKVWARFQTGHDLLSAMELALRTNARSELERWLAQLHQVDHQRPPTREATAAVLPLKVVRTPATRRNPTPRRRLLWAALAASASALAADRAWEHWGRAATPSAAASVSSEAPAPVAARAGTALLPVLLSVAPPAPLAPQPVPQPVPPPTPRPAPVEEDGAAAEAPGVSTTPALSVSARYGGTYDQDRVMVQLQTEPPGARVVLDSRVLGKTPVNLRFRSGMPFEVTFLLDGRPPLTKWMTIERPQRGLPKVTFEEPKPRD